MENVLYVLNKTHMYTIVLIFIYCSNRTSDIWNKHGSKIFTGKSTGDFCGYLQTLETLETYLATL